MSVFNEGPAEGRIMRTAMPVFIRRDSEPAQLPPQRKVDEFWSKFTTKTPGKGK